MPGTANVRSSTCGRIHEGVAVHHAIAEELRLLEPGNQAEDTPLLGPGEVGLKTDEVVRGALAVLRAQLNRCPRDDARSADR